MHLSLLCRIQQGQPHRPCSGTCDCCAAPSPCECQCHADSEVDEALAVLRNEWVAMMLTVTGCDALREWFAKAYDIAQECGRVVQR